MKDPKSKFYKELKLDYQTKKLIKAYRKVYRQLIGK